MHEKYLNLGAVSIINNPKLVSVCCTCTKFVTELVDTISTGITAVQGFACGASMPLIERVMVGASVGDCCRHKSGAPEDIFKGATEGALIGALQDPVSSGVEGAYLFIEANKLIGEAMDKCKEWANNKI